jgi:hypothetical protein
MRDESVYVTVVFLSGLSKLNFKFGMDGLGGDRHTKFCFETGPSLSGAVHSEPTAISIIHSDILNKYILQISVSLKAKDLSVWAKFYSPARTIL